MTATLPDARSLMTPHDHYLRACELMDKVHEMPPVLPITHALTAQAQVHATLALADQPIVYDAYNPPKETRAATGDRL